VEESVVFIPDSANSFNCEEILSLCQGGAGKSFLFSRAPGLVSEMKMKINSEVEKDIRVGVAERK
jgi:hypothetical protein